MQHCHCKRRAGDVLHCCNTAVPDVSAWLCKVPLRLLGDAAYVEEILKGPP